MRFFFLLVLLVVCLKTYAQEKRYVIQNPPSSAQQSVLSDTVPSVYAVPSQFSTVTIVRLKYRTDILKGLREAVENYGIKNAVILSGIGSVTGYHIHVVDNSTFPTRNLFVQNPEAPADIVNINGYIIDGRVHAHITLADENKAFGGHLEEGTTVFTFAIITLGILQDSNLKRVDDSSYR